MVRRTFDEGAGAENRPVPAADTTGGARAVRKAATVKSRTKALARRLRKGSRMASLTAEISSGIEKIAALSDAIVDSFGKADRKLADVIVRGREGSDLLLSLTASSGELRVSGAEHTAATEDVSDAFGRSAESLRDVLSSILLDARNNAEIAKAAKELLALNDTAGLLTGRLDGLIERSGIAAVNAALESAKAGGRGAEFGVFAAAAKKSADTLETDAGVFEGLLGTVLAVHHMLSEKTESASERIRAVEVMTKGVRNAFQDSMESISALHVISESISEGIAGIESASAGIESDDGGSGTFERTAETIRLAVSLIEDQETMFAGAADSAEALLDATGRIASTEDPTAALDDIYSGSDAFIRSVEATMERLDCSLAATNDAVNEMDRIRRGFDTGGELLLVLERETGAVISSAERFGGLVAKLRGSVAETRDILRNVLRELDHLASSGEEIGAAVERLRAPYRGIARFGGRLAKFSTVMECLSAGTGAGIAREGDSARAFAPFRDEIDTAAAESAELERLIESLSDRMAGLFAAIESDSCLGNLRKTLADFSGVLAGVEEILDLRFAALASKNASLLDSLALRAKRIRTVMSASEGSGAVFEEASRLVHEALAAAESEKAVFFEIIAAAEKAGTLADELYPEEE
jgi:hypothetical protein